MKFIYLLKLCIGILRTWIWTLTETNMRAPHSCYRIKERITCNFCPHHKKEYKRNTIKLYCEIAYRKNEGE